MEGDELPIGWCPAKLDDVITLHRGVTYRKPDARGSTDDGYLPLLRANNIDQVVNFDDLVFVPEGLVSDDQRLQPFDIIIAMSSGSKRLVGKAAQIKKPCDATFGAFCAVARPAETMEPAFVGWFMQTREYRQSVSDHSKGSNINNLKRDHILGVPFRVPPLPEQQRIVEKIETLFAELDKGEEALREVQKLLARYRQSVLKAAVTGTLTADWRAANGSPEETGEDLLARILKARRETWQGRGKYKEPVEPDTEGLPELPEGWTWASVEQLATVIGGLTKNKKRGEMQMKRPMLRVANVYQDRLELGDVHESGVTEGELDRVALRSGDLMVVEGNGSKDQIGRMAVWNCEIPDAVHQNHLIKVRMADPTIVVFAMKWFQSPQGRQNIELVASSTSGLYTLSISKIERLVVPVPSHAELVKICDRLDEAFARMAPMQDWCETELKRSAALRQSILKDAFSGKLVPQDPSDEPAEKLLERIRAVRAEKPKAKRKKANA